MNIQEIYYETPKQPLNIFTEYETMELLKLIEDPEIQKLFATYRKKHKYVWTLISNILAEKGINKSEDKCANRFENMKAKFFKIEKRRMTGTGFNEDTDWPYYDFFARFMNNNYITSDMQLQSLPQSMLHQIPSHQSYNLHKVKLEPGGAAMPLIEQYHDNGEMARINSQLHHPYVFNANSVPDISNQEPKANYQAEEHQARSEKEQERQEQNHQDIQENLESADEDKQQVLISPHYVNNVERTDSENNMENSNECPNPPILNTTSNSNMHKNPVAFANMQGSTSQQFRRTPNRFSNLQANSGITSPNFNAKFAKKFKKIKIDEELMTIRKEKYALELEILRFQLDNEKKMNEKHCLDLKILEERLKNEKFQNTLLEKKVRLNINETSTDIGI